MRRLLLAFALVACSDPYVPPPPPDGARACDPLDVAASSTAIATVVAAGRDKDGVVYLVDKTPAPGLGVSGERRAFVGTGNALQRKKIASVDETDAAITIALNDAADFQIKMEHTGFDGPITRMGIFRSGLSAARTFNLDVEGEVLTFVPPAESAAFKVDNIAGFDLQYAGTTADGRRLLVMQPIVDFTLDKIRVFFGTPDRMIERKFVPEKSTFASFTSLVFYVDGVETTATLTSFLTGPGSGEARIEQGTRTITTLTPVPGSPGEVIDGGAPPKAPAATFTAGLSFLCF